MDRYSRILSETVQNMANELVQDERIAYEEDPRSDLKDDHLHWVRVLTNARETNRPLYGILHGIRCGGGGLQLTKTGYKLLPGGWLSPEWADIKARYLVSVTDDLLALFKLTCLGTVLTGEYEWSDLKDDTIKQGALFDD